MWVNSKNLTPHKLRNRLTVCLLGIFSRFSSLTFSSLSLQKTNKQKTIRVSNGLNREQDRRGSGPDLDSFCLQTLSANNQSRH